MELKVNRVKPLRSEPSYPYKNYRDHKQQLTDDFNHNCGYCGDNDFFSGGKRSYHIDHFAPKSLFPSLETSYSNLVYACPVCNIAKSDDWPSKSAQVSVVENVGYICPCDEEYDEHLGRDEFGLIIPKTEVGSYMYNKLKLGLIRHKLIWLITELEILIDEMTTLGLNEKAECLPLLNQYYVLMKQFKSEQ
ncbi:hypothetical protein EOL70_13540 [Leucothrix sargassi]|nr:hypothetical protein EOL70_13540 [Leucothrix sargassi]